jgi:hypothetical protein
VTAGEFAFLAMGLVLGVVAGAALIEVLRARPPSPREVRVTMATDAVPRRSTTLADDAFTAAGAEPARGGPADRRDGGVVAPPGPDRRTPVPFSVGETPDDGGPPVPGRIMTPALPLMAVAGSPPDGVAAARAELVGVPVEGGEDPVLRAMRASAAASATAAMRGGRATAVLEAPARVVASTSDDDGGLPRTAASIDPDAPCAEPRRLADERCQIATLARTPAGVAEDALRAAQRAYDDHETKATAAAEAADQRAIRRAKDDAQQQFRTSRSVAADQDAVEAAARAWLTEINRINAAAREASAVLQREREAAREIGGRLERMTIEADAARIAAESAEEACLAARTALADCEERLAGGVDQHPLMPSGESRGGDDDEQLAAALGSGGTPRVFRLVRGDRTAMVELVDGMAGDDPEARRRWQASLSGLVEAILADAIEASSLSFPETHPFWGPFTVSQDRDIAAALSSLGYRFDGLGGWVDERIPTQRDLSMALGYAGLDPMRIRHWPNEPEMRDLFADVAVAADEHLAGAAGDLTLGELVSMLGRRADGLTDVWNAWGRLRPLLLEER